MFRSKTKSLTIFKLSEDNILTSWVGLLHDIDNYHCQWRRNHTWPTSVKHNIRTAYLITLSISHRKDWIHHQVSNDTKLKGIVNTLKAIQWRVPKQVISEVFPCEERSKACGLLSLAYEQLSTPMRNHWEDVARLFTTAHKLEEKREWI